MIDSYLRQPFQQRCIDPVATYLAAAHASPNKLTLAALTIGILTCPLIALGITIPALLTLALSGYLDTLDGTVARMRGKTSPVGTVLDIVSDRAVEAAIIIGLFLVEPSIRGLIAVAMLSSILVCVTSFLVVGIFSENGSEKSFHYSPGLMERGEAFTFFALMIAVPSTYAVVGTLFTVLVTLTAIMRVRQFATNSRGCDAQ